VVIHAAEGILTIAAECGADLIAMASHGRGGVRRLVLGSVTDKVLRGSRQPVLIVRAEG
jgi:nucleotide-binding universal stress UspA family protein